VATKVLETKASHPYLSLMRIKVEPGGSIDFHIHKTETETAVLLSGEAEFMWGEDDALQTALLRADTGVTIPPGTRHGLRNPGTVPMEALAIHTPGIR
jgi:mannose-6-phosphate isomerase-like protein (cupin superfamily)